VLSSLSPARRRVVLVVGGVVLVAALVGVLVAVLGRDPAAPPVAQDRPGPVLLVPGYGGSTSALDVLAARLRQAGRDATVVRLPGNGTGDLAVQASTLSAAVKSALNRTGAGSVDVVGYSAGGVVARLWAADGGAAVARRIVTLGSPNHGASIAAVAGSLLPGACPEACRQLAPDSPLLARLNTDETPDGPLWTSIWTVTDEVVTPPDSARLDGALNIPLQSICATGDIPHGQLPRDRTVQSLVLTALAEATPTRPTTCPRT
jgi:triacylglycerol lipase